MSDSMKESMPQQPQPPPEQPVLPEGYQQPQQPPYLPPQAPPKKVDTTLVAAIVVIVVVIATVVPVTLVLFLWPSETPAEDPCQFGYVPTGVFGPVLPTSNTTVEATFAGFSRDPPAICIKILLETGAQSGLYEFPSNEDGVVLTLSSGDDMGAITYIDNVDNEKINAGDQLLLSGLTPNSDYTIIMIWGPTGDTLDTDNFSMPA